MFRSRDEVGKPWTLLPSRPVFPLLGERLLAFPKATLLFMVFSLQPCSGLAGVTYFSCISFFAGWKWQKKCFDLGLCAENRVQAQVFVSVIS